jgi:hypothetical protein
MSTTPAPSSADPTTELKKELLLLHILATTSTARYSLQNGGFTNGDQLLQRIAADIGGGWNWPECNKAALDPSIKVNPAHVMAAALFALSDSADAIALSSFKQAASIVPGWSGGGEHPGALELKATLSL